MLPVMLNTEGKKCVIVGGGRAAAIKAKTLIKNGADVTVISEKLSKDFDGLDVNFIQKPYSPSDVCDCFITIAATDSADLNHRVGEDAKKHGALFLSCDGVDSDLMFTAYTRSGSVTAAVSTNGAYPLLGAKIRDELTEKCERYSDLCGILAEYRKRILKSAVSKTEKHELLSALISDEMLKITDINEFDKQAEKIIGKKVE